MTAPISRYQIDWVAAIRTLGFLHHGKSDTKKTRHAPGFFCVLLFLLWFDKIIHSVAVNVVTATGVGSINLTVTITIKTTVAT